MTGFYLPGDIVGLDAVSVGIHRYDAIALEDSDICVIPFEDLQRMSYEMPALQQQLVRVLSADISRDEGLLLLGGMTAEQRLTAFMLSLSHRCRRLGYSRDRFQLRMTRQDVASYLGLTLETVCRLFARFRREGLIILQQREVQLLDRERLVNLLSAWSLVALTPAISTKA